MTLVSPNSRLFRAVTGNKRPRKTNRRIFSDAEKNDVDKSKQTAVGKKVLDGIENKIVLLNSDNLTEQGKKRHGEKSLQLTTYDHRGISITTFLGNKLIQYTKF